MEKHLDALSDDSLLLVPEQPHSISISVRESHELFLMERYDWANFKPDYAVVPLTQGYFAIIDKKEAARVLTRKWWANVQYDKTGRIIKVYACWSPPRKKGARKRTHVYLHRFIKKAGRAVIVDHKSGLSLDCRERALRVTDHGGNRANGRSTGRTTHAGLKQGVELRRRGTRYGGQIMVHRVTYRSVRVWPKTPEGERAAHRWYLNRHKEFHSYRGLPENGGKVTYPIFPPLLNQSAAVTLEETF